MSSPLFHFYSSETDGQYDLQMVLYRAGARLITSTEREDVIVESKYMSRFSSPGATIEEALQAFGAKIQGPERWLQIAEELIDFDRHEIEWNSEIDGSPMAFWLEELFPLFESSFDNPQLCNLRARIYTYAEWCRWQYQPDVTDPNKSLQTCAWICFYESLPRTEPSLQDMPNWFTKEEIVKTFITNPFLERYAERMLAVFN